MNAKFQDLGITGVIGERCYPIEGSTLRIYLSLSAPPPPGWSYRFTLAWQAVEYSAKRPVGIDGDAIWIECPPDEVRSMHLAALEQALDLANERHRLAVQQKEAALERQRELLRQTQTQLEELAESFVPEEPPADELTSSPQVDAGGILGFLRRIFAATARKSFEECNTPGLKQWRPSSVEAINFKLSQLRRC